MVILEAEEIGRYRTAAVTSLAINKLRTKEMNNLAIIGTGFQAHQQLKSVIASNADFNKIYISIYNNKYWLARGIRAYFEMETI